VSKFSSGIFTPQNPQKYCGNTAKPIQFRSSWEYTLMNKFDTHPNVAAWSSESISISYQNPLTGKWSFYIPDFFVIYVDKDGKYNAEIIEIKPAKEHPEYRPGPKERISEKTKLIQTINAAKWQAAMKYCIQRKIGFRVATEQQMFGFKR
jgi:hypothetical protein